MMSRLTHRARAFPCRLQTIRCDEDVSGVAEGATPACALRCAAGSTAFNMFSSDTAAGVDTALEGVEVAGCTGYLSDGVTYGGAFLVGNTAGVVSLRLSHVLLRECNATVSGGAIFATHGAQLALDDVRVQDVHADGDGGALLITAGASVAATGCSFARCTSDTAGGAAWVSDEAVVQFTRCSFSDGSATARAAAVFASERAAVTLDDCTVSDMHADQFGGAFYAREEAVLTLRDCIVEDSTCDGSGGSALRRAWLTVCPMCACVVRASDRD